MAVELYYTSAPRGLRPQTSGFCTVGLTKGFPAPFIPRIEALSGYKPPLDGADVAECPVAYSHWIIDAAGVERHVLSAVRATAPDHTGRSNKLAHHLMLKDAELLAAGPAWLLSQRGVMESRWQGEPRQIDAERRLPSDPGVGGAPCAYWERVGGDAGWAGVIANAAMLDPSKPCSVVYPDGADALRLIAEAMLILPAEWRWRVTFTSYFMQPIAGVRCTWRFCADGTEAAAAARASGGTVVDLCERGPCTRAGAFIEAARQGPVATPVREPARAPTARPAATTSARPSAPTPAPPPLPIALAPEVSVGVDYLDDPEAQVARGSSALVIALTIACVLLLIATVVFFTLWRRAVDQAAPSANAAQKAVAIGAALLLAFASLAGAQQSDPPKIVDHTIPAEVFVVKVDGFKQVASVLADCGTMTSPIKSVVVRPEPPEAAAAGFKFVESAANRSLTLSVVTAAKSKQKWIEVGGFTWTGADLKWSLKSFPAKEAGVTVSRLAQFLSECAFVAVLEDGSFTQLSPPGVAVAFTVTAGPTGMLDGEKEFGGLPGDAVLSVVSAAPAAWSETSSDLGRLVGTISGTTLEIRAAAGSISIEELDPLRTKIRKLQKQIASDRSLIPTLTPEQRAILETDLTRAAAELSGLQQKASAEPPAALRAKLRVRASSAASGRVYGEASIELKR